MNRQTALILAIFASAEMWSQTDSITAPTHQLQEVTIRQSRRQRALSAVAPVHILDRSDMLTMGVADMGDALRRIPGITLRDYGGAGGVKTVAVRGFGAKHTGVSYDGVMLSDCQSGEIDLSRYALDNVAELSLTVGDNDDIFLPARNVATPAVLNIRTIGMPSGNKQPHITAQVKWGSFGLISPFLRYEQSLSDKFSLSAVAEYTYAENDYPYTIHNITITTRDRRTNSRMNSGHGEINFVWNTQPTSRLTGKVYYYDNSRQLPGQVRYYTNVNTSYGKAASTYEVYNIQNGQKTTFITDSDQTIYSPNCIGVDPVNGYVLIGAYQKNPDTNKANYKGNGRIFMFKADGTKVSNYECGVGPTSFVFNIGTEYIKK